MLNLSKRKLTLFSIAKEIALTSEGVGGSNGNNFRLGAVVVAGRRIISSGSNSYSGSSRLCRYFTYPVFHAEADAILHAGFSASRDCDLYVARIRRDNSFAMAKPCNECAKLITLAGIKNCYYSTSNGFEKL